MCIVLITIGRLIKFVLKNFKKAIYRIQKQEVNKNARQISASLSNYEYNLQYVKAIQLSATTYFHTHIYASD